MTAIILEAEEAGAAHVVCSCGFKGPLVVAGGEVGGSSQRSKMLQGTRTNASGWGAWEAPYSVIRSPGGSQSLNRLNRITCHKLGCPGSNLARDTILSKR